MTFIDYLVENSALMSADALKQATSKFDKLGLGKHDGSKPSQKRADQIEKRSNRKRGRSSEEEEEPSMPATRDRVQGIANTPNEIGRRPSSEREFQRMKRRVKRTRGIGSDSKGSMSIDDL